MPGFKKRSLAILLSVSILGCATLQPVADWKADNAGMPATSSQGLHRGDVVRVSMLSSEPVELVVSGFEPATLQEPRTLVGTLVGSRQVVRIPESQIAGVERKNPTNLGWIGGITIGLAYIALGAFIVKALVGP